MNLQKMIEDEIRKAVAAAVAQAVSGALAGLPASLQGAPPPPAQVPAEEARPARRRRKCGQVPVGTVANGREVIRRLQPGSHGRQRVTARCQRCGARQRMTLDAFRRYGCRRCAADGQPGPMERLQRSGAVPDVVTKLAETLRIGEPVEGTAAEFASRLDPAPSSRYLGQALTLIGRGAVRCEVLTVDVVREHGGREATYRLLRVS